MKKDQQLLNGNGHLGGTSATLYTLFLPLNYNNGRRIPHEKLSWTLNEIVRHTGGLSRYAPGLGLWVAPNSIVYRDRVLPVQLATSPDEATQTWFTRFAVQTAVLLEQQCIFLVAQHVQLLEATPSLLSVNNEEGWYNKKSRTVYV